MSPLCCAPVAPKLYSPTATLWEELLASFFMLALCSSVCPLQATCHVFSRHCKQQGFQLSGPQFSLTYETNIPRQVGLSGSSAIVISALTCLIDFYSLADRWGLTAHTPAIIS